MVGDMPNLHVVDLLSRVKEQRLTSNFEKNFYSQLLREGETLDSIENLIKSDLKYNFDTSVIDEIYYDFSSNNCYQLCRLIVSEGQVDFNKITVYKENLSPVNIIQFWDSEELPDDVRELTEGWRRSAVDYSYTLFNKNSARDFICSNFPSYITFAYDQCDHPAMKSDYFRLAYLYICGGVYVDADDMNKVPLPLIENDRNDLLIVNPIIRESTSEGVKGISLRDFLAHNFGLDGPECYFGNAPLITGRLNPIIRQALVRATNHIFDCVSNNKPFDIHYMTGPTNFTLSILAYQIHAAITGGRPLKIQPIDWSYFANSQIDLQYKLDDRNWRNYGKNRQ